MHNLDIEALTGGAPHITVDEIVSHPRLPEARKLYLDRFLAVYGDDPFLAQLLIEGGRFFVFKIVVLLDAGQQPERRETWLTVGRLKREMAIFGFASPRQVDHLLARLRAVGFLELVPSDHDRRVRILNPTEAMLAHDRDWLASHFAPLTVLCPQNDYDAVMRRDPDFHLLLHRTSMAFLPLVPGIIAGTPDMLLFFNAAAGHAILAALLHSAMAGPDPMHAPITYAELGDPFGVSRTHVRELLTAAQHMGLVKLHRRGGHLVEILPRLWSSYDRGIAGGMYLHDMVHAVATCRRRRLAAE
jgi:hypothetical protein